MVLYHGTTRRRAQRICEVGFLPRRPSKRVWFARGKGYAARRARQQAHRTHDRAVVLSCDINVPQLRDKLGKKKVRYHNGILAIDGPVAPDVVRSHPLAPHIPTSPDELAAWVNQVLRLKPHKGVSRRDPGVERLSKWVMNRLTSQPNSRLTFRQILHKAQQWLPDHFAGVVVDPDTLHTHRHVTHEDVAIHEEEPEPDERVDRALALLEHAKPDRRARGLALLAEMDDPDLFDWCTMHLGDRSVAVRVAALRAMLRCEMGDPDVILPLARSPNKRVRAAAVAALAKLAEDEAERWFKRGLKDPEPCVRLETAAVLDHLDPAEHRGVFELARHDPNPDVERRARKLTEGKGYSDGWS